MQGSRRTPYKVEHPARSRLSDRQWEQVLDALAEQAIFAAQLLNGEMPPDIEEVFQAVKVPLFPLGGAIWRPTAPVPTGPIPASTSPPSTTCWASASTRTPSCSSSCAGGARSRSSPRCASAGQSEAELAPAPYVPDAVEAVEAPALDECLETYWSHGRRSLENLAFDIAYPAVEMALLKRLGAPDLPGWDGRSFRAQMTRVYDGVTLRAIQVAFADSSGSGEAEGQN